VVSNSVQMIISDYGVTKFHRFIGMFLIMVALSFVTVLVWPTHLTWWALIIALIISAVWMVSFQQYLS
jgi:hypothetical protein